MDIPDCEITTGGIINIHPYDNFFLKGKSWDMILGDSRFMKHCLSIYQDIDKTISCKEQNRINMIDKLVEDNSQITEILFSSEPNSKINRKEFKDYILYSSVGLNKFSIAILVEKQTGKTTEITGAFSNEHLKWLRLEPL